MKRIGRYTLRFEGPVAVIGFSSAVGKKEGDGPLGSNFDHVFNDDFAGQTTFEKAESAFIKTAFASACKKAYLEVGDVDIVFGGDLLNQCAASNYAMRDLSVPFAGLYGACSTFAESLCLASVFIDSGASKIAGVVTSSHFCSSERQFRYPLEYGGVRPPSSQWTVTGSGAAVLTKADFGPKIEEILIGRVSDLGICDINNMGAAMAPAAAQTVKDFFADTNAVPDDFDMILTGDLGFVGSELFEELMRKEGIDVANKHFDCGCMIFDRERQDVHAGGSGCGCCASVVTGYILKNMAKNKLKNVLFVATGALMSTTTFQQGESIPGIAHLVHFRA